jgi:hypothetical protein
MEERGMTDEARDTSVEVEATQMAKNLRQREGFAWALGILFYGFLEFMRLIYLPDSGKWFVFGWLIPVECLMFMTAFWSSISMQSALKERGYSNERSQFAQSIALLLKRQDTEGLRLLRGIAMAGTIYAFPLGMVMAGIVRTYFFN